jgi:hypothetical protein
MSQSSEDGARAPAGFRPALLALGEHDAYHLLGAGATDDDAALQRAYRRRMRSLHPDAGGDPGQAQLVNLAWSLLSTQRAGYDRWRAALARGEADLVDAGTPASQGDPWEGATAWTQPLREPDTGGQPAGCSAVPSDEDDDTAKSEDDDETRRQWAAFERELRRSRRAARTPGPGEGAVRYRWRWELLLPLAIAVILAVILSVVDGPARSYRWGPSKPPIPPGPTSLPDPGGVQQPYLPDPSMPALTIPDTVPFSIPITALEPLPGPT